MTEPDNKDMLTDQLAFPRPGQEDQPPLLATIMGVGGLIPFFLCAGAAHSGVSPWDALAVIACGIYGAIILSFIGAVHWGLALQGDRDPKWFAWSVVPALYAWPVITLLDPRFAALVLVPGFIIAWSVDRHATAASLVPPWYMRMRTILTLGASLALAATSLAPPVFLHP